MGEIRFVRNLWVLVADGEKALFLRNEGTTVHPDFEVVRELHEANPPTREQGTDRPGRFNDGASVHKSAVEETDWHRVEKERFAREIADRLYRMAHRGDFARIVLVAPPLVLGELRKEMHKTVCGKVIAEVPKTLTNHSVEEIKRILQNER